MVLKITYKTKNEYVKATKIEQTEMGLKIFDKNNNNFIIYNNTAKIEIIEF